MYNNKWIRMSCLMAVVCVSGGCTTLKSGALIQQAFNQVSGKPAASAKPVSISVDELLTRARGASGAVPKHDSSNTNSDFLKLELSPNQQKLTDDQQRKLKALRNRSARPSIVWRVHCLALSEGNRLTNSQHVLQHCRSVSQLLRETGHQVRARLGYSTDGTFIEVQRLGVAP